MPSPAPPLPLIHPDRCTGCGWCVASCDLNLLSLQVQQHRKRSTLADPSACTGCSRCARRCLFGAIEMQRPLAAPDGLDRPG